MFLRKPGVSAVSLQYYRGRLSYFSRLSAKYLTRRLSTRRYFYGGWRPNSRAQFTFNFLSLKDFYLKYMSKAYTLKLHLKERAAPYAREQYLDLIGDMRQHMACTSSSSLSSTTAELASENLLIEGLTVSPVTLRSNTFSSGATTATTSTVAAFSLADRLLHNKTSFELIRQKYTELYCTELTGGKYRAASLNRLHRTATHSALYSSFGNFVFKIAAGRVMDYYTESAMARGASDNDSAKIPARQGRTSARDTMTVDEFTKIYGTQPIKLSEKGFRSIRFTPGYLRFFRKLRTEFRLIHGKRFAYQHRLTRYISRFKGLSNYSLMKLSALNLSTVLVNVKLAATEEDARFMIKQQLAYVNGAMCTAIEFQVQRGDIVQLATSYNMYATVRFSLIRRLQLLARFARDLAHYSHTITRQRDEDPHKGSQTAELAFNRVKIYKLVQLYFIVGDVSDYVELDYLTLSAVILSEPCSFEDFNYINIRRAAVSYIKMLNWKYIN